MITRPMLAAAAKSKDLEKLVYPLLASPKLDGIRCIVHPELGPVSRSFKPIPNEHIRRVLSDPKYKGLDGEIMVVNALTGKPYDFNTIQSAVMSRGGEPRFELWTFDLAWYEGPQFDYRDKYQWRHREIQRREDEIIKPLNHIEMIGADAVLEFAAKCIAEGYEGIVLRDPLGHYKSGRSTLKQQGMIKYKEFADAEGIVIGFEELYRNRNPQEPDNFGLADRSHRKEGMEPADTLGALILQTRWGTVSVGSGFDFATRDLIWNAKEQYLGKTVTFKYQTFGMQSLPRFPIFLRFREPE